MSEPRIIPVDGRKMSREAFDRRCREVREQGDIVEVVASPPLDIRAAAVAAMAATDLLMPGVAYLGRSVRQKFTDRIPPEHRRFRVPGAKRGKPGCYARGT
jgi:hypothetical protein